MQKILSLVLVFLLVGCGTETTPPPESVLGTENMTVLSEVDELIGQKFFGVGAIDSKTLEEETVRGYVAGLGDEHTVYFDPEETKKFDQDLSGNMYGIGAKLKKENERIVVEYPLEGSPAENSGLRPEDIILAVDEKDIMGESIFDVVDMIHGDVGTTVLLTVLRPSSDEMIDFVVERAEIDIDSVTLSWEDNVAVIKINSFDSDTSDEYFDLVSEALKNDDLEGIVLDLRYNGGGLVDQAIYMTSFFLPLSADIVSLVDRDDEVLNSYGSVGMLHDVDTPLAVLINGGSASASEIMAGALQDNKRAIMVGEQSYGKGSVQEVVPLSDGGSLKVTIAHWYTPDGKSIQDGGITPDEVVEYTLEDYENDTDPQLKKAVEVIKNK